MILLCLMILNMEGAAWDGTRRLVTWGDQILEWSVPELTSRVLAVPSAAVGEGGCIDSQRNGLFLQEGDRLVYRHAPHWDQPQVLDHGIVMHNCVVTTLLGRHGVLMTERGMQVRFYEFPDFHYREVYSFYSASAQGGLVLTDIDGDGRADILCGNYWIQSPAAWEFPWHDFAIELYNEERQSATLSLALDDDRSVTVAQGHLANGRVARFVRPADPKQMWTEEDVRILHFPHAVAPGLVAENNGPHSRVYINGKPAGETDGVHTAFRTPFGYVLAGRERVYLRR